MILITRKHFLYLCILLLTPSYHATGLQGVPSWICLGLKSPFIKFGIKEEQLANTSIPLNITKDEQAYMHQEGLRKLGTFIKPIDLRDSATGFVKADLTKRLTFDPPNTSSRRIHPIQEEMDQKQIILLDEDTDENGLPASLTEEDRKFIVPMALKNISPDPRALATNPTSSVLKNEKSTITFSSTTEQLAVSPTSNIDDLKKHILFLHNMTKTNTNFESKFVKFPSLQKDRAKPLDGNLPKPVKRPQRPIFQYSAPIAPPTYKAMQESVGRHQISNSSDVNFIEAGNKVSTETRVPLLNETQSTTAPEASQIIPIINKKPILRTTKRPPCLRNPDSPKCLRQRRREEQQRQQERDDWFRGQSEFLRPNFQPIVQTINNTKRFAVSIEIPDSFKVQTKFTSALKRSDGELLSRLERSPPRSKIRMAAIEVGSEYKPVPYFKIEGYNEHDIGMTSGNVTSEQDFLDTIQRYNVSSQNESLSNTSSDSSYTEQIDTNPKNCFGINGLSYSQKKQCVKHTSVMPAISRGARAAIQECQFQFKNRRWNCSVTNDETVFGPITSIAAPEMAFIHALAAATVTSFIARACRDGQLSSCGCSRGTRPKQLHDDWSWGGCGDNLEYAYKFATEFIDVREKEANRETRGVKRNRAREGIKKIRMQADDTKVPEDFKIEIKKSEKKDILQTQNNKLFEISVNDNKSGSSKHKDLLELQQRITKEILNSKLKESEMLELKEKINREIINSKILNGDNAEQHSKGKRKNQRAVIDEPVLPINDFNNNAKENDEVGIYFRSTAKARSLMNLHNNEAGRRAVIKKTRITCKCHGVSGSCSLITCWQQLSSIREIGDYLHRKYEQATKVQINKRGRLQVKDSQFNVPTAHDLIYLDESPNWCRTSQMLHWPGTHGRVCRLNSSGLESCAILCCGRGYNTKNIIVHERCNCKFHWCCQVKCQVCTKVLKEHTCK